MKNDLKYLSDELSFIIVILVKLLSVYLILYEKEFKSFSVSSFLTSLPSTKISSICILYNLLMKSSTMS